jgi:hypothetical protein
MSQTNTRTFFDSSLKLDSNNIPLDKEQNYFPLHFFPSMDFKTNQVKIEKDTFLVKWYSKHLYAMKEPILYNRKFDKEIYRFTWLRTFHNPISIRIEKEGENYKLIWKLCNGAGGYEPGDLIVDKEKLIDKITWDEFKTKISNADFWNLDIGRQTLGLDGAEWILEGVTSNNYYVVNMWSPTKGNFYDCCSYLIDLTDLNIKNREKY